MFKISKIRTIRNIRKSYADNIIKLIMLRLIIISTLSIITERTFKTINKTIWEVPGKGTRREPSMYLPIGPTVSRKQSKVRLFFSFVCIVHSR